MAYWNDANARETDPEVWRDSVRLACHWSAKVAMVDTVEHGYTDSGFKHLDRIADWRGSFRGEYNARNRSWDVFCPVWHGGQGLKALAMAAELLGDEQILDAARRAADFLLRCQVADGKDTGLLLAYEAGSEGINTSAILECLDGFFTLARVTGETRYSDAAIAALRWVQAHMFMPDEGLFLDDYDPIKGAFTRAKWLVPELYPAPGRPLLDDGVFVLGYQLTGDKSLLEVAVKTADRLLKDESPAGNWKAYPPAHPKTGIIHPRHAYWWGRPMWMVHQATGDERYLACARRSAEWYFHAMRTDGGLFRNTGPSFETPSFGHATSGIACAAILWLDLAREYADTQWNEPIHRALNFCRRVQFTEPADGNLKGAILEKVIHPDNSDAPPWYLRDVGTFFYIQAVCQMLQDA